MRLINANNILYKDLNADMPQSKVRVWVTFKEWIDAMPTVEERKTGTWEIYVISMLDGEGCRCSECGYEGVPYWDYCPNCGAKMEAEHEAYRR